MFPSLDDLDPAAALARAVDRRRTADRAEAELLAIAAHWADLHPVLDSPDGIHVKGMERLMPLAGPGTPEVAEFAPAELGAALGISSYAAQHLVGDSLELRHRLPRLWKQIMDGSLQAWRGRQVADRTNCLSPEAAAWVDAHIAPFAHKIGLARVIAVIDAALIRFDPEQAARRAKQAADGRGVWLSDQMTDGTTSIRIEADALDAAAFDETIDQIADALAQLGDPDVTNVRRAKAVGVIADPQGTLNLLTGPADSDSVDNPDATTTSQGAAQRRPTTEKPRVTLYVHLHADAIRGHSHSHSHGDGHGGVGRVEDHGPVTVEQIKGWLGRTDVTIKPVIDLHDRVSVDAYEFPDRIRETVLLRNPCCPFPWCTNITRRKDIDHIEAYQPPDEGGPPGQTAADKLAPLCRRHHRLKTHSGWTYTQPEPGIYLWRSPQRRRYLVDHTGATALEHAA